MSASAAGRPDPRSAAAGAASPACGPISGSDVEQLLRDAAGAEDRVRRAAASRLALVRDRRAVDALVTLLGDRKQSVQEAAGQALGHRGDAGTAEALSALLGSSDLGLRNRAGTVLAGLGEVSVPVLVREITSPSAAVRKFVVEIMGEIRSPWVVANLVHSLRDEDLNVAFAAAEALGKFPAAEVAEHLIQAFRDRPQLRPALADSLGLQGDPRAVPLLLEALRDPDLVVRFSAANALGQIGSIEALQPLMEAFRESPVALKHAIIRAVTRVTEHHSALAAVDLAPLAGDLLHALGSEEWQIRAAALRVLALCPADAQTARALAGLLDDPVEEVRALARRILERLPVDLVPCLAGATRAGSLEARCVAVELLATRLDRRAVQHLQELLKSDEERLRAAAALALGQCGESDDAAALCGLITDPSPAVRAAAARAMGWMGALDCAGALRTLLDDEAQEVRESAIGALVLISDEDVVRGLRADLADRRPERQRLAARALGYIGDARVVEPLLEALTHADSKIRESAALSLGRLQDRRACEALLAALEDSESAVRKAAVDALSSLEGTGAVPALRGRMLHDPDPWVRYHVVSTVGRMDCAAAAPVLVESLGDGAPVVVIAAAEALGGLHAPETLSPLIALLQHPEEDVLRTVIHVLARWGGDETRSALSRFQAESPAWREVVDRASASR